MKRRVWAVLLTVLMLAELPLTVTNLPDGGWVKAFLMRKYDQTVLCDAAVYGK